MKFQSKFICQQCGYVSGGWLGKCPECNAWNSFVEEVIQTGKSVTGGSGRMAVKGQAIKPIKISEIKTLKTERIKTNIEEFDRVLGGGIIPGAAILITGEPGVGKSTLLSCVLKNLKTLYISGEESASQIKVRLERLKVGENFWLLTETNVENIISSIENLKAKSVNNLPDVFVIDSIQTLVSGDLNGSAGSVGQVRECANKLLEIAKRENMPIFIIGHVTKDGTIAGPKILEHMVDTVLYLEGERFQSLRLLRSTKNRFGPTDEVGVFKMINEGMSPVNNPSEMFLGEMEPASAKVTARQGKIGSIVTITMEGTRPILAEIQALVVQTQIPVPRRVVSGLDYNRVQLIIAVLQKYLHLPLYSSDIYVSVSGGLKISEPSADLAISLAIWSSFKNKALPEHLAAFGEIGLLGEIRLVGNSERRAKEAKRLGFKTIPNPKTIFEVIKSLS